MPPLHIKQKSVQHGFTLLELSVVLSVFGIMVGAIFIGQNMFENARIKKDLSLIEQVISATKSFELKYEFLPGDLPDHYSFFKAVIPGGFVGNGDNRIGIATGGAGNYTAYCSAGCADQGYESTLFWLELAEANLIKLNTFQFSNIVTDVDSFARQGIGYPLIQDSNSVGLSITSTPSELANVLVYGVSQQAAGQQAVINNSTIPPIYSRVIDTKMDDGKPQTGLVQNRWNIGDSVTPFSGANCTAGSNNYPTNNTAALCTLRIETKF